ncbi:MAG: TonB family protein [Kiritimatiellae bacterium]|nr:TonB family protein [Kiritimatiellia bacterium]
MYVGRERRPGVIDVTSITIAVLLHIILFGTLWYLGTFEPDEEEITVIPLEFVLYENLDGVDGEPPPEAEPVSEAEPAPPEPVAEPKPPVPPEDPVIIPDEEQKPDPPKVEEKKPDPPKVEEKKPDPPKTEEKKPSAEPRMTREERIAKMRESIEPPKQRRPVNNGRTAERPKDWEKLLGQGFTPSNRNSGLDADENQKCLGRIYKAYYDEWDPRPAWTPNLKEMVLEIKFDLKGNVTSHRLTASSGDGAADRSVLAAAAKVKRVPGLTRAYLETNRSAEIHFKVEP